MAATRHVLLLALGFSLSSLTFVPAPARAQAPEEDAGTTREQGEIENANFKFKGRAKSTVFVRSGPRQSFYATMKLDKGAEVTVVAEKNGWLKILPPPGSFSYVPKAYVERRGTGGKIARVTNTLNVRAGSTETQIKTTVQTKLEEGQDVTILGEQDEYYKIVPPEGEYLFVQGQFIRPIGQGEPAKPGVAEAANQPEPPTPGDAGDPTGPVAGDPPTTPDDDTEPTDDVEHVTADPAPDARPTSRATAGGAGATQPAAVAAGDEFRKLEAEFDTASKQPVVDQPLERLTEAYTKLVKANTLTGQMKRMAEARLMVLGMRAEAREQLEVLSKNNAEMTARQHELQVEKQEIDERIAETQVTLYSAVGVLRVSSLQQGPTTLYRLTDPATGRTVVYLRSNDAKLPGLLNQFVGVRGEVTSDARRKMRIIEPTAVEPTEASKVNNTVIATITPPSMIAAPAPETVSTDQGEATAAE